MIIKKYLKVSDIEDYIDYLTDSGFNFDRFDERLIQVIRLVKAVNYTNRSVKSLENYVDDCMSSPGISLNYKYIEQAIHILNNYKVMRELQRRKLSNEQRK
ncbi:hypothetical protein [Apilactobacillus timberlakei]|uniref:Uncharacterized protein n=1 Tax=Apilactobacillus timberlakei TaxID=2008380 RepID=A0ABY2YRG0_9LACO|nr:hypothetical protein [Apilactobacillus timberlakei]TPR12420.1 hypothetical protein DY048_07670 [Apilactobacillus timberlakei]TPR12960.1 hypothetical protein DY052_08590 [Apilactobacillus timberlakei]